MKKMIVTAAAGAAILMTSRAVQATEVIYGFNDATLSSFTLAYDQDTTATFTESTTTGVTEGTGAAHIAIAPTGGGYDQVDVTTGNLPADLVASTTTSLSADLAANYQNAGYITVAPEFYLDGTTDGTTPFGMKLLFPSQTLAYDAGVTTDHTYTYSVLIKDPYAVALPANYHGDGQPATPADGNSTTATYTPGQIIASITAALQATNSSATGSVDGFGFEETTNTDSGGGPTDLGDDLYIDNVTVPVTPAPEPASLGVLALGGMAMFRRRKQA